MNHRLLTKTLDTLTLLRTNCSDFNITFQGREVFTLARWLSKSGYESDYYLDEMLMEIYNAMPHDGLLVKFGNEGYRTVLYIKVIVGYGAVLTLTEIAAMGWQAYETSREDKAAAWVIDGTAGHNGSVLRLWWES